MLFENAPVEEEHGETVMDLLTSAPHWIFEAVTDLVFGAVLFLLGVLWQRHLVQHFHRDLDKQHQTLDAEHGVVHGAQSPEQPAHVRVLP